MRTNTEGREKGKSVEQDLFIHCGLNSYISLFYCVGPISFPRAWERNFSSILKTMTASGSTISLLAILLLLKPVPVFLSQPGFIWRPRFSQRPWWKRWDPVIPYTTSWWCTNPLAFFVVHVSFSYSKSPMPRPTAWDIPAAFLSLRMKRWIWCRDSHYTLRILFWTFA